jgi:2-polyprenyl-3-methyl-5-hydroxy-6-metoxy-1,4-benzoquinol methylase
MEQVVCDLCGANDPRPFLITTDRFSRSVYNLVICNKCQLVYLNPRPGRAEIEEQYPADYEAYKLTDNHSSSLENWHYQRSLDKQLNYVELFRPDHGQLLDVGCATGNFLNSARDHGWNVMGIEIQDKAAEIARQHYKIEVITGDLKGANLTPSSQDVVTLWDVLEHLFNPRSDLLIIHELLKPGGMVYFSIPNLDSYDRKLFQSDWIGWDVPRHLTLFTEHTINRLLNEIGFEVVDRRCLLGGRGAFLLSIDRLTKHKPQLEWLRRLYPIINLISWPYRQIAYLRKRGPIIYYAIRKISA